jgi:hypothetical protein
LYRKVGTIEAKRILLNNLEVENLGHAKEIVTCNNYIDNTKLTVIKLDRLDDYITSVAPPENGADGGNCVDLSGYVIDINSYIP